MRGLCFVTALLLSAVSFGQLSPEESRQRMIELNRQAATRPAPVPVEKLPDPNWVRVIHVRDGAPAYVIKWVADQPELRKSYLAKIDGFLAEDKQLLADVAAETNHLILSGPKVDIQTDSNGAQVPVENMEDVHNRKLKRDILSNMGTLIHYHMTALSEDKQSVLKDPGVVIFLDLDLRVGSFGYLRQKIAVEHVSADRKGFIGRINLDKDHTIQIFVKTDASTIAEGTSMFFDKPMGIMSTVTTELGSTLLALEECDFQKWAYLVTEDHTPGHENISPPPSAPVRLAKPVRKWQV